MSSHRPVETQNQSDSLVEKLTGCAVCLTDLAIELREALVHRNSEQIWKLLTLQEEQAVLLDQYTRLWKELHPPRTDQKSGKTPTEQRIRSLLIRLRALQQSNAILAHSFLSGVRKSLAGLGKNQTGTPSSYSAHGRTEPRHRSRLIHFQG